MPGAAFHRVARMKFPNLPVSIATFSLAFLAMTSLLRSEPLKVGDIAPALIGTDESGNPVDFVSVYQKNKYTLVYFYPKADTPGCTAQGCSLRDAHDALAKAGVAVIGVSVDDVAAQKAFHDKYGFQFSLVADTDMKVKNAFGVPGDNRAARQAYLIKEGRVIYADYKGSTTKQAEDILAAVKADDAKK